MSLLQEYLVSYGKSGGFGRFASKQPLDCHRGEKVVVRTERGLEIGTVLCPASSRGRRLLTGTYVGSLLRTVTPEDQRGEDNSKQLAQKLFAKARGLAKDLALTLEIIDAEITLDAAHATLHFLAKEAVDVDPIAAALGDTYHLHISFENLAEMKAVEESPGGCGKPGCGHSSGGGCSSCGSGGCSSCSSGADLREYFAHLRGKMEEHSARYPLV